MQRIPPKVPGCTQSPYHLTTRKDVCRYREDAILGGNVTSLLRYDVRYDGGVT